MKAMVKSHITNNLINSNLASLKVLVVEICVWIESKVEYSTVIPDRTQHSSKLHPLTELVFLAPCTDELNTIVAGTSPQCWIVQGSSEGVITRFPSVNNTIAIRINLADATGVNKELARCWCCNAESGHIDFFSVPPSISKTSRGKSGRTVQDPLKASWSIAIGIRHDLSNEDLIGDRIPTNGEVIDGIEVPWVGPLEANLKEVFGTRGLCYGDTSLCEWIASAWCTTGRMVSGEEGPAVHA